MWPVLRVREEKVLIPMTSTVLAKFEITRAKYHGIFFSGRLRTKISASQLTLFSVYTHSVPNTLQKKTDVGV